MEAQRCSVAGHLVRHAALVASEPRRRQDLRRCSLTGSTAWSGGCAEHIAIRAIHLR
jgi:hypothetical protein